MSLKKNKTNSSSKKEKTILEPSLNELLGRKEVDLDMKKINKSLFNRRILVTGAGGSIGSELVKECLRFKPLQIVCLDNSEEKIFGLEFKYKKNKKTIKVVLADINNETELDKVFKDNKPEIIFHAAAFKHVTIQESHPWCSVKTNVGGTYNLILLSDKYLVKTFILVSTDKAVNPVSIMGATKKIAEDLIRQYNNKSKTRYAAVRFGNVLGSSGSVIPIFQNQIRSGGPITITHPEITRFFMSIQEASQLILQCCTYARDREIFILKMGMPIKILDLANQLIKLSGHTPGIDIPIHFTGLRIGEKLHEELRVSGENIVKTKHDKIIILKHKVVNKDRSDWNKTKPLIESLLEAALDLDIKKIKIYLKKLIPTYQSFNSNINRIEK
ncbi:polysaccharide biosynthesis protein [Candidatus Marinimicrobia bacterium]|nr:polysaccharide biosynthesis protein [Candidatus Neomarinimicrobiota bacterium]